jgi:MOSC domain-containing protein
MGDRLYAFHDTAAPEGFPFLTGREQEQLLLYQPRFRNPENAALPPNVAEPEGDEPGLTPVYASADLSVDIETPSGEVLPIDDPNLITRLSEGLDGSHALALLRSDRSFTDCRPVSIFSLQTVNQLGDELGFPLDQRRFRANIYADLTPMAGFAENSFIGRDPQMQSDADLFTANVTMLRQRLRVASPRQIGSVAGKTPNEIKLLQICLNYRQALKALRSPA